MSEGTWNLLDASKLHPSHASLPTRERRDLYEQITQRFKIHEDHSISGDIADHRFASTTTPIPKWLDIWCFLLFNLFVGFYFFPIPIMIVSIWYFFSHGHWLYLIFTVAICVYIRFHPVQLWREFFQNAWVYAQYNYFSYRFVYHSSTKDHVTHQILGTKGYEPLIFAGGPHGIFPYAIQLMPFLARDALNRPIVITMADVLLRLPLVRQIYLWIGGISASKKSIVNALSHGYNIGLVADGIAGMFIRNERTENLLLKHRKGIAKLSLQTGASIVPCHGFGSTEMFDSYFDSFGVMRYWSRKLKMAIIGFAGRYWTFGAKRVPLYFVMGPVMKHPNNGVPIPNPTQQQIDEYHDQLLFNLKTLFDSHKGFYGWPDKEINFI
eukprot:271184_1